ncbi:hypothetical protein L6452_15535 [Arctium lappa]|uniref:Uncharacterized protein n=1 Tax=Arctium lappa TaxID=4217 RepID=A0ACB9CP19_ARCLA|nr:hypothetical protein L6452_15535 [Arctium lappa]
MVAVKEVVDTEAVVVTEAVDMEEKLGSLLMQGSRCLHLSRSYGRIGYETVIYERFMTKIKRKTLTLKWFEEFKIPITPWGSPNTLEIEVRDKDHFVDDTLGFVSISYTDDELPAMDITVGF